MPRHDSHLDLALLDVEDGVCGIALREDDLLAVMHRDGTTFGDGLKEHCRIKGFAGFRFASLSHWESLQSSPAATILPPRLTGIVEGDAQIGWMFPC